MAVSRTDASRIVEEGMQDRFATEGAARERPRTGRAGRWEVIVREVRSAVGKGVELCIDANCGYDSPAEAIRVFRSIESYRIKYFEQPVAGIARLAKVNQAIDVPVMADESAWNVHDVIEIVGCRAAEIVSIYTTKPGGLYNAMQVGAVARAAGLQCNVNGSVELGVGNLANIHLAAASPAVTLSCVVPVSTPAEEQKGQLAGIYYTDDLIVEPFGFADGAIRVPDGPGFGNDVPWQKSNDTDGAYRPESRALAAATTFSGVIPKCLKSSSGGAEAP